MLTALSIKKFEKPSAEFSPGPAPQLQWIDAIKLAVDGTYQRSISRRGAQNVRLIAEHFDWSKFAPVIVAPLEGGGYAIVDGQHRTTAAMLCGIEKVPCQIVQADRAQQAAAFAAVNGSVTKTMPAQLYHARCAAGDAAALEIAEVCSAAGVTIVRTNLSVTKMKVGQAHCIGAITRCVQTYGKTNTILALRCITQTADGNAGFLRATIVEALAKTLSQHAEWQDSKNSLLQIMEKWSWPDVWGEVTVNGAVAFPHTLLDTLVTRLDKYLTKQFERLAKKRVA